MRVKGEGGRGSGGSGGSGGRGTFDGFWVTGLSLIARSQGEELDRSKEIVRSILLKFVNNSSLESWICFVHNFDKIFSISIHIPFSLRQSFLFGCD